MKGQYTKFGDHWTSAIEFYDNFINKICKYNGNNNDKHLNGSNMQGQILHVFKILI